MSNEELNGAGAGEDNESAPQDQIKTAQSEQSENEGLNGKSSSDCKGDQQKVNNQQDKPIHPLGDRWKEAYGRKFGDLPEKPWKKLSKTDKTKVVNVLDGWQKEQDKANQEAARKFRKERIISTTLNSSSNKPNEYFYEKSVMLEHFDVLGFNDGRYWFLPRSTKKPISLSSKDVRSADLMQLMDLETWRMLFPKETTDGIAIEPFWLLAGDCLIKEAHNKGYFRMSEVRGQGFWNDGEIIIFNDGENLLNARTGAAISRQAESNLSYYYQRSMTAGTSTFTASNDDVVELYEIIKLFPWVDPDTAALLHFGWLVTAPFCGILRWRSHIWITAPKGAGKSDTVSRVEAACVMKNAHINAKGSTSEAGIRQYTDCDACPALIDEMEPNTEADRRRIERIVEYTRNASSDDEAQTFKGTAGGNGAVSYQNKTAASFKSINHHLTHEADISRYAVLAMMKKPTTKQSKKDFEQIYQWSFDAKDNNFAGQLVNYMMGMIDTLLSNIKIATDVISDMTRDSRMGNQYGTLIGGAMTAIKGNVITYDEVKEQISKMDIYATIASDLEANDTGWSSCWAEIASLRLDIDGLSSFHVTIGEALDWLANQRTNEVINIAGGIESTTSENNNSLDNQMIANGYNLIKKALARYGIRYQKDDQEYKDSKYYVPNSDKGIYLSRKNTALAKRLKSSKYANWNTYAQRVSVGSSSVMMSIASGQKSRAEFISVRDLGV